MSHETVALVMAGGLGSRMAMSDPDTPKPLTRVSGFSLVELVIYQILRAGISDITLSLRHQAETIERTLRNSRFIPGNSLTYLVETEPLGTIGALAEFRERDASVLVVNGDLLSGIDLPDLLSHHFAAEADLTITTHSEHHRLQLGEVVADESHRVLGYREKPVKVYRISSGTYIFEPCVSRMLHRGEWASFPSLVNDAVRAGCNVVEYYHTQPWIDVNDARGLERAREMLANDPIAFGVDPSWSD